MKWLYRHPRVYDLLDSVVNLRLSDKARDKLVRSIKGKVLEVGIGSGKSVKSFSGDEFFGVDNSIYMLRRALSLRALAKQSYPHICVASAHNLPFKAQSFDKVLFIYTLRVLTAQDIVLDEAFRVGKEVIVLEFKPVSKLFEWFGKRIFGSSNITPKLLSGFTHMSYFNRFDIYCKKLL